MSKMLKINITTPKSTEHQLYLVLTDKSSHHSRILFQRLIVPCTQAMQWSQPLRRLILRGHSRVQ